MNTQIDWQTPSMIREMGIDALLKELGPVGMARFIRQFDRGLGDYTAEREQLLEGYTMEDFLHNMGICEE